MNSVESVRVPRGKVKFQRAKSTGGLHHGHSREERIDALLP
jgi:hypothetical protein